MTDQYTPTTEQVRNAATNDTSDWREARAEFNRWLATVEAAAEQRGAYRAACQAFRHAATAFDYPEASDQYCTWADVAKWLRANADKHDPEHRADHCGFGRITDSPIEIDRKAEIMYRFATHDHAF